MNTVLVHMSAQSLIQLMALAGWIGFASLLSRFSNKGGCNATPSYSLALSFYTLKKHLCAFLLMTKKTTMKSSRNRRWHSGSCCRASCRARACCQRCRLSFRPPRRHHQDHVWEPRSTSLMVLITPDFVKFFWGFMSALRNWVLASAVHLQDMPTARLNDFCTLFKRSRSVTDVIGTRLDCIVTYWRDDCIVTYWRDVVAANIAESSRCTCQE